MICLKESLSPKRSLIGIFIALASLATGACDRAGSDAEDAAASDRSIEQSDQTPSTALMSGPASGPPRGIGDQPTPQPSLACFERLADAEGEMELAHDPAWRKKALQELAEIRARRSDYRADIEAALDAYGRSRDALQAEFDSGEMAEDDFNSARSELEMKARGLLEDRALAGLPECNV